MGEAKAHIILYPPAGSYKHTDPEVEGHGLTRLVDQSYEMTITLWGFGG